MTIEELRKKKKNRFIYPLILMARVLKRFLETRLKLFLCSEHACVANESILVLY